MSETNKLTKIEDDPVLSTEDDYLDELFSTPAMQQCIDNIFIDKMHEETGTSKEFIKSAIRNEHPLSD